MLSCIAKEHVLIYGCEFILHQKGINKKRIIAHRVSKPLMNNYSFMVFVFLKVCFFLLTSSLVSLPFLGKSYLWNVA